MLALATTTITIYRGTTTDQYGDTQDVDTPLVTGVPCSLLEQTDYVQTQDQPEPMIVRRYTGRVNPSLSVQVGDRLLDESTGQKYMIDSFSTSNNPLIVTDTKLHLRILN